MNNEIISELFA